MEHLVRSQRGITLMEIMIAATIIGIGLAAVCAAIPFAAYAVQEGRQLSTAAFLANERLEQVRSARWELGPPGIDDLGLSPSATAAPVSGTVTMFPDEAALAGPHAGYARSVRINDCGAGAGCSGVVKADLRQVTVTVTYRAMTGIGISAPGTTKAATVTTYVAQR